jgi:glutamyl-tRNA reductase
MKLRMVGCSHHRTAVTIRERLAFSPQQTVAALRQLRERFPDCEAVLLSTCNRVELYLDADEPFEPPPAEQLVAFLAEFHGLDPQHIGADLFSHSDQDAVRHLFMVAASLDSMVMGEAQILSQVRQAFLAAQQEQSAGLRMRYLFDAANRVAKRVNTETEVSRRRVSIPSVAVADYVKQLFETVHDKRILLIGAGEMGEETLRYLGDEGARDIVIVNRHRSRAEQIARRVHGQVDDWSQLEPRLVWADLVVSTTGSREPIVTAEQFQLIEQRRDERLLFILDLAVPRDFDPEIGNCGNVYLYCIDDLQEICRRNREKREREWPKAKQIVDEETDRFIAELTHRGSGPTILRLKQQADQLKADELGRLWNKLGNVDCRSRQEIERAFDRLVNKLLHAPLESLRDEANQGSPHRLLDALRRLFQIPDG